MKTINLRNIFIAVSFVGIMLFIIGSAVAQQGNGTPTNQPLQQQFSEMVQDSNPVKSKSGAEYRVVSRNRLNRFWGNAKDSLTNVRQDLQQTQERVATQESDLNSMNTSIREKDAIIAASEHDSTHISVLGIDFPKEGFLNFFWIAVLVLVLLLGGAIYQYRNSQKVTSRTRQDYRKLQHELEEFRKTSLEKERRLRRELQTERNLVEELRVTSSQKR
ncbi:hypothetical protein [Tunicatimonas pelagia]|uniref:hypothetical protein n=1 Tax=Tunicatimonas pelagia TaxID=931531 RepID=UPI00266667E9|nr:hypothetical protein [Tunicatimonas pelagia]WKN41175.1 hypothetical protein P0M28_19250 [Tunicatimonas pelagia]